jgi:predicted RNase H-like HicB family nuclease
VQEVFVRYSVLIAAVNEAGFEGYDYAHVPSLDLTTHGLGIEGAPPAAQELVEAWVAEKRAHGEAIPTERHSVIAQSEVGDAILRP